MATLALTLIILGLVVYAIERNHRREVRVAGGLAGSGHVEDRDAERVLTDLRAASSAGGDQHAHGRS
jgi:hypothetical protein